MEPQPLVPGRDAEGLDDLAQQLVQVIVHRIEGHLAGLDFGKIQDIVQNAEQMAGRVAHGVDVVALFRGEPGAQRDLGEPHDGVHGRTDLVAHAGQESAFGLVGPIGLLLGAAQRLEVAPPLHAEGQLFGDRKQQLRIFAPVALRIGSMRHGHDAQHLLAHADGHAEPDRRRAAGIGKTGQLHGPPADAQRMGRAQHLDAHVRPFVIVDVIPRQRGDAAFEVFQRRRRIVLAGAVDVFQAVVLLVDEADTKLPGVDDLAEDTVDGPKQPVHVPFRGHGAGNPVQDRGGLLAFPQLLHGQPGFGHVPQAHHRAGPAPFLDPRCQAHVHETASPAREGDPGLEHARRAGQTGCQPGGHGGLVEFPADALRRVAADEGIPRLAIGRHIGVVDEQVAAVGVDKGHHVRRGGDDAGVTPQEMPGLIQERGILDETFIVQDLPRGISHGAHIPPRGRRRPVAAAHDGFEAGHGPLRGEKPEHLLPPVRIFVNLPADVPDLTAQRLGGIVAIQRGQGRIGLQIVPARRGMEHADGRMLEAAPVAAPLLLELGLLPAQALQRAFQACRTLPHPSVQQRALAADQPLEAQRLRDVGQHAHHDASAAVLLGDKLQRQCPLAHLPVAPAKPRRKRLPVAGPCQRGQSLGHFLRGQGKDGVEKGPERLPARLAGMAKHPAQGRSDPDLRQVGPPEKKAVAGSGADRRAAIFHGRVPDRKKQGCRFHAKGFMQGFHCRKRRSGRAALDLVEVLQGHAGAFGQGGLGQAGQATQMA